jgi:hypothetical protein
MGKTKEWYITPKTSYTDKDGNWFITFDKKAIKKIIKRFSKKAKTKIYIN